MSYFVQRTRRTWLINVNKMIYLPTYNYFASYSLFTIFRFILYSGYNVLMDHLIKQNNLFQLIKRLSDRSDF